MPITIVPVGPTTKVALGTSWDISSDFIGPLPIGSHFNFSVTTDTDHVNTVAVAVLNTQSPQARIRLGGPTPVGSVIGNYAPEEGATVQLLVQLSDGVSIVDTGTSSGTWSQTVGLSQLVTERTGQAQGQGGLTAQEHSWLDAVQTFVTNTLNFGGKLGVHFGFAGIAEHIPFDLLHGCDAPMTLTGRGSLTRPGGVFQIDAYGLLLAAAQVPPGFGRRDGAVIEYKERLCQLLTLQTPQGGGGQFVTEAFELTLDSQAWMWRNPLPDLILYDVTPGCVISAQWLCFSTTP